MKEHEVKSGKIVETAHKVKGNRQNDFINIAEVY